MTHETPHLRGAPGTPPPGHLMVLLADDEDAIVEDMAEALREVGHQVRTALDGDQALAQIRARPFDLVISDVRLPAVDGLSILRHLRAEAPSTDVVLMSGYATVTDAVAAMKADAVDYLCKPFEMGRLLALVSAVAERRRLRAEAARARTAVASLSPSEEMVGHSAVMVRLRERLAAFAASDAPVLLLGESGTGKELAAHLTHRLSPRHDRAFIAVNCAAFPDTLLESEMFGHVRGAFTGAVRERKGRLLAADGGTLFLDEVAELSQSAQAKLLRVLEEGTFSPIGSDASVTVDVRLISATNQDLKKAIREGRFREDLYFRLKVLDAQLPQLSQRQGDLPLLAEHFVRRFSASGQEPPRISPRAWAILAHHPFAGNVRELEHAIRYALVLSRGRDVCVEHLPDDIRRSATASPLPDADRGGRSLGVAVQSFEREYIVRALVHCRGKRQEAADLLGISRKHLWQKIRDHHITDEDLVDD